ncbi:threonine--tRNA ligase, partial [Candidatus Nomurabacteria bacterium]|nr:threonine--tRNA ligase [Candidatus Nomurabacteria bacterium]
MNNDNLEHLRHSLAHLMASAVLELYPDTKLTIGPAIDTGFYYDFEFSKPISDDNLKNIEKVMKKKIASWKSFEGKEVTYEEAKELFQGNPYKLELIEEIKEKGETITLYTCDDFTDLCRGGHSDDLSNIDPDSFKLDKVAGAYWRGDEKNAMLTRIYGLAFGSKEELEAFKKQREEAKERDHRKIGKEMDLFTFSDLVGAGLPLWTPKGTILRNLLDEKVWELRNQYNYTKV